MAPCLLGAVKERLAVSFLIQSGVRYVSNQKLENLGVITPKFLVTYRTPGD
jgi:hypothetical protein